MTDSVLGTSRRHERLMTDPNEQHPDSVTELDEPTGLRVHPVAGRIGSEVVGVDLGGDLADDVVAAIGAALVDHKVLFFRGQHLDPASHVAFARQFGTLTLGHPTVPALDGHPNVFELDAAKGARANVWHTDVTFVDRPPASSILNAVTIPPFGGDTVWANTDAGYHDLPDHLRSLADQLWARHSNTSDYGSITTAVQANTILAAGRADLVALARPHLTDPSFALHAAAQYGSKAVATPVQYGPGRDALFRNSRLEREELLDLRRRARPASHAPT